MSTASRADRARLRAWAAGPDGRLALRARIVLSALEGVDDATIARACATSASVVARWRTRFVESGPDGLRDAPRCGAPRRIDESQVRRMLAHLQSPPPSGAPAWTTREMAGVSGLSQSSVARMWRAHGIEAPAVAVRPGSSPADASGADETYDSMSARLASSAGRMLDPTLVRPAAGGTIRDSVAIDPHTPAEALPYHDFLTARINLVSLALERQWTRYLREQVGLTLAEWRMLVTVGRFGALTFGEVVDIVGLDKALASRASRTLLARRLVVRESVRGNRRTFRLRLAAAGSDTLRRMAPVVLHRQRHLAATLTPRERQVLGDALDKLAAAAASWRAPR